MISQPKVQAMIDLIYDFDLITVNSEAEALLLEGQLIKQTQTPAEIAISILAQVIGQERGA